MNLNVKKTCLILFGSLVLLFFDIMITSKENLHRQILPEKSEDDSLNLQVTPDSYDGPGRSSSRREVTVVIGVPTVNRPLKKSYLTQTLDNLIGLAASFQDHILIQILVADFDAQKKNSTLRKLKKRFFKEIEKGFLEIFTAENEFYTNRSTNATSKLCDQNSGQSCSFLRWRNKQNLDYSFLMNKGAQRGKYYVQFEDDVECNEKFFPQIFEAIKNRESHPWLIAEVSSDGFIGKMFHSDEALLLAKFLREHYDEKACDWLYLEFLKSQPNPCLKTFFKIQESSTNVCKESFKRMILYEKEILCRHLGKLSSLPGKSWT